MRLRGSLLLLALATAVASSGGECALMRATRFQSSGFAGAEELAKANGELVMSTLRGISQLLTTEDGCVSGARTLVSAEGVGGVAVGSTGAIYATDSQGNQLLRVHAGQRGRSTVVIPTQGLLAAPSGCCVVKHSGAVFVANTGRNNIVRVADGGASVFASGSLFDAPVGIIAHPTGNALFVTNLLAGTIVRVTADGASTSVVLAKLRRPWGLAFSNDASLFVTASGIGELVRVHRTQGASWESARGTVVATQLGKPRGVVTAANVVYVADYASSSLYSLRPVPPRAAPIVVARVEADGVRVRIRPQSACGAGQFQVSACQFDGSCTTLTTAMRSAVIRNLAANRRYTFVVRQTGAAEGLSNEIFLPAISIMTQAPTLSPPAPTPTVAGPQPVAAAAATMPPTARLKKVLKPVHEVLPVSSAAVHNGPLPQSSPTPAAASPPQLLLNDRLLAGIAILVLLLLVNGAHEYWLEYQPLPSSIDGIFQDGFTSKKRPTSRLSRLTFAVLIEPFISVLHLLRSLVT